MKGLEMGINVLLKRLVLGSARALLVLLLRRIFALVVLGGRRRVLRPAMPSESHISRRVREEARTCPGTQRHVTPGQSGCRA